jgi:ubiquinol-cytochrome c reductase cytochrome c1 subunit
MIKPWILVGFGLVAAACGSSSGAAEEGGIALLKADTDISNTDSLQRGARNFMNYCSGCHSIKYLRYNRMAEDLKIPPAELQSLMFTTDKAFDGINSAMPADAVAWFGKQPPDLSLMSRERGNDYMYSYLKGFYVDKARPWGVNNLYLQGSAMPHVLAKLQGLQKPVFKPGSDSQGGAQVELVGVEPMSPGTMKPEEYDQFVRDLANFLDYAGEPIKDKRQNLGVFVMLFLVAFFVFAYLLKKEYWKDVH